MTSFGKFVLGTILATLFLLSIGLLGKVDSQSGQIKVMDTAHGIVVEELKQTKAEVAELKAQLDGLIKEYEATASWYGPGFHGKRAADGSIYNQYAYTIAHKTLPFGTIVIVEYNGKRVPAVVTDRGPYIKGRDFDLSLGMAEKLGMVAVGVAAVRIFEVQVR